MSPGHEGPAEVPSADLTERPGVKPPSAMTVCVCLGLLLNLSVLVSSLQMDIRVVPALKG